MRVITHNAITLILATMLCGPAAAQSPEARLESASPLLLQWKMGSRAPAQDSKPAPEHELAQASVPDEPAAPRSPSAGLNLFVLVGDRAINSLPSGSANPLIVEVRDEENMPVEGAEVVFQLPSIGPSGFFPGRSLTWMGRTDPNGQVTAPRYTPNQQQGRFSIRVNANYGESKGRVVITQRNSSDPMPPSRREVGHSGWWKVVAVAAAGGAVGGIVWATRGGGDKSVSLQPGSISIGAPR